MEHVRTYACIHLDNIKHNMDCIRSVLLPGTKVIAVVKANAYGHGANAVSRYIEKEVAGFAVSNIVEGIRLRECGIIKPVLILGYTPPADVAEVVRYNLTQAVFGREYALSLSDAAVRAGVNVAAHLKIDSGMTRIGFRASDKEGAEEALMMKNIIYSGIFTHFSSADGYDEEDKAFTEKQYEAFIGMVEYLRSRGAKFDTVHCCNSAAAMKYGSMQCDAIRFGISLYGMTPSCRESCELPLREAMTLKTTVAYVKQGLPGDAVSYGRTNILHAPEQLVTVAMGYADGYPRRLSNKGVMYCNGYEMKVTGRVCMDQIVLRGGGDIKQGDTVEVFGYGTPQSVSAFARMAETINYEITCGISARVPRVYMTDGKEAEFKDTTP